MMAEEIEQHELERVQTARLMHEEYIEYCDMRGEEMVGGAIINFYIYYTRECIYRADLFYILKV